MNDFYDIEFKALDVKKELDKEGKEKRILIKIDKNIPNALNLLNALNPKVISYNEKIRK